MGRRKLGSFAISRIGMPQHAHRRIAGQDSLQATTSGFTAIGDHHHPGVLLIAYADAAAVMDRNPGRSRRTVDEGI